MALQWGGSSGEQVISPGWVQESFLRNSFCCRCGTSPWSTKPLVRAENSGYTWYNWISSGSWQIFISLIFLNRKVTCYFRKVVRIRIVQGHTHLCYTDSSVVNFLPHLLYHWSLSLSFSAGAPMHTCVQACAHTQIFFWTMVEHITYIIILYHWILQCISV